MGDTTADAARRAGFLVGRTGRGGLQNLLDELGHRTPHLLRLAGEDRATLRVPDQLAVDPPLLSRAVSDAMSADELPTIPDGALATR